MKTNDEFLSELKKLDIQENSSDKEGSILIDLAKEVGKDWAVFAEIGSWKGKTGACLGFVASQFKNSRVFCIDHFQGNLNTGRHFEQAQKIDLLQIFRTNMKSLGFWQNPVRVIVSDSITASTIFKDKCLDLLFIDGGHWYNEIYADIKFWLPKIKEGGIICGHDCQEYYPTIKEEVDKRCLETDCGKSEILNRKIHFGVIKAVYEHFGDKFTIHKPYSIWSYKI